MRVLLVDPSTSSLPEGVAELLSAKGWEVQTTKDYRAAAQQAQRGGLDAIVLATAGGEDGTEASPGQYASLVRIADAERIATVLMADGDAAEVVDGASLVDVIPSSSTTAELSARLATLRRSQALVRRMEKELANMERLGKRLNQHFTEVDQEMRLAGRLQRDFLPHTNEPIGPLRFATVFRPASWVSGDIYDIIRVDERHVAFYVADAVGHGMAASLLTMFIKRAIVPKRVRPDGYDLLTPCETLSQLNEALAAQELPNCQFVTACYCLVNTETLEMQYARGGHTYPLLISADGVVTELKSAGGLMGLFPDEEFPTRTVQLRPGEKVVIYSDGLEAAYLSRQDQTKWTQHRQVFQELAHLSATGLTSQISEMLDQESGSLNPRDDVTVVAMEVER